MATIDKSRMEALYELGFLRPNGKLSNAETLSLRPSALTANRILAVIWNAGDNGASAEQISHQLKISENTVFSFCRVLLDLGLIDLTGERGSKKNYGLKNIYLRKE